ncbi:hypothetical protein, partial [Mesorhizobium sp.]|uniref:hypothetical protein n=1 Tax=Mesorhizobium sp. TaxID=1871066 RepID=UPI001FE239F0
MLAGRLQARQHYRERNLPPTRLVSPFSPRHKFNQERAMANAACPGTGFPSLVVAILLVAAAPAFPAQPADGKPPLDSTKPGATIVDSDVRQEEALSKTEAGKVITAIDRTRDNIGTVRKTTKLDTVDIVFLTDAARSEGGPPPAIENKVKQHQEDVAELRQEIEANALLFNAIDSRRVQAEDVLAVEFDNPGKVVIYAAAKPPK